MSNCNCRFCKNERAIDAAHEAAIRADERAKVRAAVAAHPTGVFDKSDVYAMLDAIERGEHRAKGGAT